MGLSISLSLSLLCPSPRSDQNAPAPPLPGRALRFAPRTPRAVWPRIARGLAIERLFGDAARRRGELPPPPASSGGPVRGPQWRSVPIGNGASSGGSERWGRRAGAGVRGAAARRRRHAAAGGAASRRDLRLHWPPLRFVRLQRIHRSRSGVPLRCLALSAISSSTWRS